MKDKLFILLIFIFVVTFTYRFIVPEHVEASNEEPVSEEVVVEVKGLVKNPGVYTFETGARLVDLVNKAGGLLENADMSCINQTKLLKDQMVLIIASSNEVKIIYDKPEESVVIESKQEEDKVIEVCTCEFVKVSKDDDNNPQQSDDVISLNEASIDQLATLPGIGLTKAQAIIDYRTNTPFSDPSEIVNVKGIGSSTYEKIKHLIKK